MTFRYISNNRDTIEFDGESPYFADADVLRGYEISYDMVRNVVTRFKHDAAVVALPIKISASSPEEGAELFDKMQRAFEHDVRIGEAGRLELDSYHANVFITTFSVDPDDMHDLFEITVQASVLFPSGVWIRENTLNFSIGEDSDARNGFDYPYDFDFDYAGGVFASTLVNDFSWPCPVRIIVYGPASNPFVYIGDNRYEVDVDVPAGGKLVIDGMNKSKIDLLDQFGNVQNVFNRRIPGVAGSGTYIFEQVKPGHHAITWDGSFLLEVTLLGERSMVPC